MPAWVIDGIVPRRLRNSALHRRVPSSMSGYELVTKRRPAAVSSPKLLMSVLNRAGVAITCFGTIPNSPACFTALTVSAPALARAMTYAPELCAPSKNELKSLVPSGWRAVPLISPPLSRTAFLIACIQNNNFRIL